jgi:hypothetical protein
VGEHLLCKQGVVGSIPSASTILEPGSGGVERCGGAMFGSEKQANQGVARRFVGLLARWAEG